jgi:hypothetical protein
VLGGKGILFPFPFKYSTMLWTGKQTDRQTDKQKRENYLIVATHFIGNDPKDASGKRYV